MASGLHRHLVQRIGNGYEPTAAWTSPRRAAVPDYQLGWAENNRIACLKNLGPLTGLVRAFVSSDQQTVPQRHAALVAPGERHFDSHVFCPEGGQYTWLENGQLHVPSTGPPQNRVNPRLPRGPASWADYSASSPT